MKMYVKMLMALAVTFTLFSACSKKDNPTDNDLFIGTYHGTISYNTDGESKATDDGKVTVVKVGSNYNFVFSDGIPDLKGVQFKKDGDGSVVSIDDDTAKVIRISASKLVIGYAQNGAIWTADCNR